MRNHQIIQVKDRQNAKHARELSSACAPLRVNKVQSVACRAGGISVDMAAMRQLCGKPAILPIPLFEPDDHNVDETCEFSTLAFAEHLYDHSDCSAATCS